MEDYLLKEINEAVRVKPPTEKKLGGLFMGGPGSGKTTLIGTSPMPLIFDFDHGLTTLDTMGLVEGEDYYKIGFEKHVYKDIVKPEKIDGKMVQTTKKVEKAAKNISKLMQYLAYAADKDGSFKAGGAFEKVETIAVDGITRLSEYFLYEIQSNLGQDYISDKAGYDGYGQILKVLGEVCQKLIQCKKHYHVILTALPKSKQRQGSKREGDDVLVPFVDGSFTNQIGSVMDEFYLLRSEVVGTEKKHMVYSQPLATVPDLRSRSKVPGVMDGVTFPEIMAAKLKAFEENTKKCS